ncbi:MAG TPA: AIR synthase-related protein [Solirubrobacterales bacterium]|jgi:thiamine-monophosphate kinase|nr:AIR synthase-related protein [Solirubrobacterales bacterium]
MHRAARLRARQLEPQPRLAAGKALAHCGASAMIDLSDGLGGDALHLSKQSGVALRIDAGAVPLARGAAEVAVAAGCDSWQLCLNGGEDYELLASIPPQRLAEAERAVSEAEGVELTRIGEALAGSGVEIRLPGGRLLEPAGFDQLA